MRLSANAGICDDLRQVEYEAEREHWYLRGSDMEDAGEHRRQPGGRPSQRAFESLLPYCQDPYSLHCVGNNRNYDSTVTATAKAATNAIQLWCGQDQEEQPGARTNTMNALSAYFRSRLRSALGVVVTLCVVGSVC
jgi:hypothetical protein